MAVLHHNMITGTIEVLNSSPHVVEWTCPDYFKMPKDVGFCVYSHEYKFWNYSARIAAQPHGSPRLPNIMILAVYGVDVRGITRWELELRRANGTILRKSSGSREPGKKYETIMRIYVPAEEVERGCNIDDALKVRCTLYWADPEYRTELRNEKRSVTQSAQTEVVARCEQFSCDMEELMLRENYCDLVVKVEDKEYKAHRSIFGVRSPVFTSMFKHQMTENITGVVDIDDCDKVTFREFMRYLYAARVGKYATNILCNVYRMADKYQVNELKAHCLEYIMEYMAVEHFSDAVSLALQYDEEELMEFLIKFFDDNMEEIKDNEKWKIFEEEYPEESDKVLLEALKIREKRNAKPKPGFFQKLVGRIM